MNHDELIAKMLQDPEIREAYDQMEPEFELLRQMLHARKNAGLTQSEVAERMGTKAPAITRLESSLGSGKHSPSISTLQKYAQAVGCELQVTFVPSSSNQA